MLYIVLICLALVVGVIWGLYLSVNLGIALFVILLCISVMFKNNSYFKILIIGLVIFLFGNLYGYLRINNFKNKYDDGDKIFEAKILSMIGEKEYYNSYICKNESNDKMIIYIPKNIEIMIGETIHFNGEFEKPTGKRNTGGYDYSMYLYSQNIYGIIKNAKNIYHKELPKFNLIYNVQQSIFNTLGKFLPKDELRHCTRNDDR